VTSGLSVSKAIKQYGPQVCERHHRLLNSSFCVNLGFEHWRGQAGQWCYVGKQCTQLNGGRKGKGASPHLKMCQAGNDELLRDKSLKELEEISRDLDIDLSLLVKQAYPTWHSEKWNQVEEFFRNGGPSLDESLRKRLQQTLDTGIPIVFDVANSPLPTRTWVAQGKSLYQVDQGLKSFVVSATN